MTKANQFRLKYNEDNDPIRLRDEDLQYVAMKINKLYSDDMTMESLENLLIKQTKICEDAENEIQKLLHECAAETNEQVEFIDKSVQLLDEIADDILKLKEECDSARPFLNETTKELWQLHNAKKNLAHTIKTVNLISVLNESVEKLADLISENDYKAVESLIVGYDSVAECLQEYSSIEQFGHALEKYDQIKKQVYSHALKDIKQIISSYFDNAELDTTKVDGYYACRVLSLHGKEYREEVVDFYMEFLINEFHNNFPPNDKKSQLESIDRRFSWFKRTLIKHDQIFHNIFPKDWHVDLKMTLQFYSINESQIKQLLQNTQGNIECKLLLYVVQKCLLFNDFCVTRFPLTEELFPDHFSPARIPTETAYDCYTESVSETCSLTSKHENSNGSNPFKHPFDNRFTDIFKPFLTVYIKDQSKALDDIFAKFYSQIKSKNNSLAGYLGIKDTASSDNSDPLSINNAKISKINYSVFPSAGELFLFFKHCFMQCSQFNSVECLLQLVDLFRTYLDHYLNMIIVAYTSPLFKENLFPIAATKKGSNNQSAISSTVLENITVFGCVVCTLEYCIDTTVQLELKIKSVVPSGSTSNIELKNQIQNYTRFLDRVINEKIVGDLTKSCKPIIQSMHNIKWDSISQVGDHSSYVSALAAKLTQIVPVVRNVFESSRKVYTQICINFAVQLTKLYDETVFKCHPLGQCGTEQILLDLHLLKTILQSLPSIGTNAGRKIPQTYAEAVLSGVLNVELDLKMVSSPLDPPEEFVIRFISIVRNHTPERLRKILQMKNLKGDQANRLVEIYNEIKPKPKTNSNLVQVISSKEPTTDSANEKDSQIEAKPSQESNQEGQPSTQTHNTVLPDDSQRSVYDIVSRLRKLIK